MLRTRYAALGLQSCGALQPFSAVCYGFEVLGYQISTQVGVGAFVVNERREVLVVQEKNGPLHGQVQSCLNQGCLVVLLCSHRPRLAAATFQPTTRLNLTMLRAPWAEGLEDADRLGERRRGCLRGSHTRGARGARPRRVVHRPGHALIYHSLFR